MTILCISDTHGLHDRIPKQWFVEADVIVHAGDISNRGNVQEIKNFCEWFDKLQYDTKIFIGGNHDYSLDPKDFRYENAMQVIRSYKHLDYLCDEEIIIDGIKFYGSPQTPYFRNWAFNCARNEVEKVMYNKPLIKDYWDKIPKDTNVLITHGPSYGWVDQTIYNDEHLGCKDLYNKIREIEPALHVCGHIHSAHGEEHLKNITFVNASVLNERYEITYKPILIEI